MATTGAADTYVWACPQTLSAYYDGLIICVDINATNTGASTINVDSLGAKAIKKHNDQALAAGDLEAGGKYLLVYDVTNFQLLSQVANAPGSLSNVVEDTTPQLGGDLDLNGNNIDFPTTPNVADCLDEDNMASDSAVSLATQQSIKAYVDTEVAAIVHTVVQQVYAEDGTYASTATAIPNDDTIPQITEGAEAVTVTITPTDASYKLLIEAGGPMSSSSGQGVFVALFQDATANALKATGMTPSSNAYISEAYIQHRMTAGTTSATTFRLRFGSDTGTAYRNGDASAAVFSTVAMSWIRVTEYTA